MEISDINWPELKIGGLVWRKKLWTESQKLLTSLNLFELSEYNHMGYFHRVFNQSEFKRMQQEWEELGRVPPKWVSKGNFPGIWTALFDPCNTFSFSALPVMTVRFFFRKGYFIFDSSNRLHKELLKRWKKENESKENPWQKIVDGKGQSLEEKMNLHGLPSHKGFFEDNDFGASIGYSDYISVVIVLEDSIQMVKFSVLK